MNIENILTREHCMFLKSNTKTEVLLEMMESLQNTGIVTDMEGLKKDIFYREQIMSTGIGQGIGVPHVRFEGVTRPVVLMGIHSGGIEDYDSLDGVTVKIVVMILVGAEQHKEYLRILSMIVRKLKQPEIQQALVQAGDASEIETVMRDGLL